MNRPIVLAIAGFDPSSGAGATADLKTIAAHGCYGVSCLTALTIQSTLGVEAVEPIKPELVANTLACLANDLEFQAVKVGMLGTREVAIAVASFLERLQPPNLVIDPVLVSSSGKKLLSDSGCQVLLERLLPLAAVITPNVDEVKALGMFGGLGGSGSKMDTGQHQNEDYWKMAETLQRAGARNVVVTGGHRNPPTDLLLTSDARKIEFPGKLIESGSTHGTGCAFSSAVACNLALGLAIEEAVFKAKDYVAQGMLTAYRVGKGVGPLNHFPAK